MADSTSMLFMAIMTLGKLTSLWRISCPRAFPWPLCLVSSYWLQRQCQMHAPCTAIRIALRSSSIMANEGRATPQVSKRNHLWIICLTAMDGRSSSLKYWEFLSVWLCGSPFLGAVTTSSWLAKYTAIPGGSWYSAFFSPLYSWKSLFWALRSPWMKESEQSPWSTQQSLTIKWVGPRGVVSCL